MKSRLLANIRNHIVGVILGFCHLPRDPQSAELILGPPWKPGLQFKSQEAAGLCLCWAAGKHADCCQEIKANQSQSSAEWEKASWKPGYKGTCGANTFTWCCALEEVRCWFGFFGRKERRKEGSKLQMGRGCNHPHRAMPGLQEAPLPITPPPHISHLGPSSHLVTVPRSLELYPKTNWFTTERPGLGLGWVEPDFHVFPATFLTSYSSQLSSGCRVSVLPVAPLPPPPIAISFSSHGCWLLEK